MNSTPANPGAARRLTGQPTRAGVPDRISASRSGGMGISGAFARLADREAEAAVIASILSNPPIVGWRGVRDEARRCGLTTADFQDVRLAELFALVLDAPAEEADFFGWIVAELRRRGRLDLLGGENFLRRLRDWDSEAYRVSRWSPGGRSTVEWLAPMLKRYTARRKALAAGIRFIRCVLDDGGTRDEAAVRRDEIDAALSTWPDEAAA